MTDPIDAPFLQPLEPTAQQQGVDVPGFYSATTDFINFGVYNGNFRVGPPQAASNLDVATSVTGSNFLPGWRFVQSSNTTITARHVENAASATGSNVRFTLTNATAGHAAFIEQIVDVGGSTASWLSTTARAYSFHSTEDAELTLRLQYLTTDGTITGMPPEFAVTGTVIMGYTRLLMAAESNDSIKVVPPTARYLRIRAEVKAAATVASGTVDIFEVRRNRGVTELRLVNDSNTDPVDTAGTLYASVNELWFDVNTTEDFNVGGSSRLVSRQLVPIPFSLVNVPANATTEMQPFDNALGFATPRIGMGWPGDIVGVSYRMSTAITAGGATALRIQPTIAGASQFTAFTLTTSSNQSGEASRSLQAYPFTGGQQLGVQLVTSSTFAPTTLDMACILWVAITYDGA